MPFRSTLQRPPPLVCLFGQPVRYCPFVGTVVVISNSAVAVVVVHTGQPASQPEERSVSTTFLPVLDLYVIPPPPSPLLLG